MKGNCATSEKIEENKLMTFWNFFNKSIKIAILIFNYQIEKHFFNFTLKKLKKQFKSILVVVGINVNQIFKNMLKCRIEQKLLYM